MRKILGITTAILLAGCAFQGPSMRLGHEARSLRQDEAQMIVLETIKQLQEQSRQRAAMEKKQ